MPTIEERALALLNEATDSNLDSIEDFSRSGILKALFNSLEDHDATLAEFEAFRREVSDAVELDKANYERLCFPRLSRFILAKPDPLVEVFREVRKHHAKEGEEWAEAVVRRAHDAAAELGYKLKLVEVGDAD